MHSTKKNMHYKKRCGRLIMLIMQNIITTNHNGLISTHYHLTNFIFRKYAFQLSNNER